MAGTEKLNLNEGRLNVPASIWPHIYARLQAFSKGDNSQITLDFLHPHFDVVMNFFMKFNEQSGQGFTQEDFITALTAAMLEAEVRSYEELFTLVKSIFPGFSDSEVVSICRIFVISGSL